MSSFAHLDIYICEYLADVIFQKKKKGFATLCTFATLQDPSFQPFKHHSVSQDDGHTRVPRLIAEIWDGHRQLQQAEKVIWDGCLKGGIKCKSN